MSRLAAIMPRRTSEVAVMGSTSWWTPGGLLIFAALFVPIWLQWSTFSYYGDQCDTDDPSCGPSP